MKPYNFWQTLVQLIGNLYAFISPVKNEKRNPKARGDTLLYRRHPRSNHPVNIIDASPHFTQSEESLIPPGQVCITRSIPLASGKKQSNPQSVALLLFLSWGMTWKSLAAYRVLTCAWMDEALLGYVNILGDAQYDTLELSAKLFTSRWV